ncbi:MAG TPA: OB-fold nucleic acid binding domain-containing protein, partial [Clostridia bacterium]|nr:OB-fold nucleic acid binding domain-containing protein [Clostridia bacterium]
MERTPIKNLTPGREVKIQGFVEKIRDTRAMAFLVVRDRSGKVQVTLDKTNPAFAQLLAELTAESVVTVEGYVAGNKNVKLNGIELLPEVLRVESVAAPIPLTKDSAIDVKLDYRWLCFRGEREQLLFRAQTLMAAAMRSFLLARGFVEIHTPKLIGAASESGADVFEVGY